jgi:hypothetical protein
MEAVAIAGPTRTLAEQFVEFLETGTPPPGLFADDLFCDFTLPHWRLQAQGVEDAAALRRAGHPAPSTVVRSRLDETGTGFVLEVEERWQDAKGGWYCRELFRADADERGISALSVYCTGDWDEARQAEHARTVQLLRP